MSSVPVTVIGIALILLAFLAILGIVYNYYVDIRKRIDSTLTEDFAIKLVNVFQDCVQYVVYSGATCNVVYIYNSPIYIYIDKANNLLVVRISNQKAYIDLSKVEQSLIKLYSFYSLDNNDSVNIIYCDSMDKYIVSNEISIMLDINVLKQDTGKNTVQINICIKPVS